MPREREDQSGGYISGVPDSSRRFPLKGIPMDEAAERGLMRLRGELGEAVPAELVVTEKWFQELPVLRPPGTEGKILPWEPRYDTIRGVVYTTKTDTNPPVRITSEGRKALPNAEKFEILAKPPWRKNIDLTRIPKSWRVTRLIPQGVWDGVTGALRQMDEIKHDHKVGKGVEYRRVEELFIGARRLFQGYTQGRVGPESIQHFAEEIFNLLQAENVLAARHPNLEELEEIFAKALSPDSRWRRNPQAKRMQLYKGLRDLTRREVQTGLIARRADRVFRRLYVEWENQKFSLVAAKVSMEELGQHSVFRSKKARISDAEITHARAVIKEIKDALSAARTAPFLLPAAIAEAILVSKKLMGKERLRVLRRRLKVGGVEDELGRESVEDLLMQRRAGEALIRLRHSHSIIQSALEDPDNFEITVFDR